MDARRATRLAAWLVLLLAAAAAAHAQLVEGPQLSEAELADTLRRGGNVIYFRHADTGPATPDPPGVDLSRCETQRNLNDSGRAQAAEIAREFQRLRIPVGAVRSSQFCRCKETAQLAFGRYEVTAVLTGVARGPEFAQARSSASEGLRALLATVPPAGENIVLVSHGFNLIDLEGLYLSTQGEAAVFHPDGAGGYTLLARVLPAQWSQLPAGRRGTSD
jgi:phosphohistidine phosphatase SixA